MTGITLFYLFWQDLSLVSVFVYVMLKLWTIHFQFVFSYVYISTGDRVHFLASWEENEASQKDKLWVKLLSSRKIQVVGIFNFHLHQSVFLTGESTNQHLNQGRYQGKLKNMGNKWSPVKMCIYALLAFVPIDNCASKEPCIWLAQELSLNCQDSPITSYLLRACIWMLYFMILSISSL